MYYILIINYQGRLLCKKEELERFNALSEKALHGTATHSELLEYKNLLSSWNSSVELHLYNYLGNSEHL